MKNLFSFLLILVGLYAHGQMEEGNYASAASEFMAFYNVADYDGIFNMFDVDMKKALPREQAQKFFAQKVNFPMGGITKMEFNRLDKGAHIYRTSFEKAIAEVVISLNPQNQVNALLITPVRTLDTPLLERNSTKMILPFKEEWFVFWGGTNVEQNYHVAEISQQFAYDILMVDDGSSFQGDPKKNESYYAFGKDIIAPCDARVVSVIKGVKDNVPGILNPDQLTGNTIVLEADTNEYILMAHLREGSITVQEGQDVRQGDVLAQCGNSGNSTEPHLHLSLQNHIDMEKSTGAKLFFERVIVNGEIKEDYLPVKEDFVKNIE